MKAAKIIGVILLLGALIGWVRHGQDVGHIARSLPFCGGHKPGFYDLGALAVLGLVLWGLSRLRNAGKSDDPDGDAFSTEAEEAPQVDEDPAEAPDDEAADPANQRGSGNPPSP